jgi:hypothetical protein
MSLNDTSPRKKSSASPFVPRPLREVAAQAGRVGSQLRLRPEVRDAPSRLLSKLLESSYRLRAAPPQ